MSAMTGELAERAPKIGGTTLGSIGNISREQRLTDNDERAVAPKEMLTELCADNQRLAPFLRSAHKLCDKHNDLHTASLIENWIDEAKRRQWFSSDTTRAVESMDQPGL